MITRRIYNIVFGLWRDKEKTQIRVDTMKCVNEKIEDVKIAYIGGGSRQWAWGFMSDLILCEDMSGEVYLYDIDYEAAKQNEKIGNLANTTDGAVSQWTYTAVKTQKEALKYVDFVVISILPGTFDEMESDVHAPEKFGIYQSVGDTIGSGGICGEQELIIEAGLKRDLKLAFEAFRMDNLVRLSETDAKTLFDEMIKNTSKYLGDYLE